MDQLRVVIIAEPLANVSRHAVRRLLKRVKSHGSRGLREEDDSYLHQCDSRGKVSFINYWFLSALLGCLPVVI